MTIDEAIEILSDSAFRGLTAHDQNFKSACILGIEALKAWKLHRYECHSVDELLLPGETER